MATILSEPPSTATSGEKVVFNRLKDVFSENSNAFIYFEPELGGLRPDFLVLSPEVGILIVEVKDYDSIFLSTITQSGFWTQVKENQTIQLSNPFDQLYQYWRVAKDRINHGHFPFGIDIPIIRVVVFSKISKESYLHEKICEITPKKIHCCFSESASSINYFQEFLNEILPVDFTLENKYFQILRANLIPTCRLPSRDQKDLLEFYTIEDKVTLLDIEQERMAHRLGEGHRLIFGVAGSGKTVVLIARARYLALRNPKWRILVLCYNRLLMKMLFNLINPQDFEADITINTFHGFARHYILSTNNSFSQIYSQAEQKAEKEKRMSEFFHEFVPTFFLELLKSEGEQKVQYDAILIDEAQDFEPDWFKIVIEILNPVTNSLLITCDGLQGIYARKQFTWSSVGIQARGRVLKFENSYRTPIQIGVLAQKALPNTLRDLLDKFDEFISTKNYMGKKGLVEIMISKNRKEEYKTLVGKISRMIKEPQDILVLFKYNLAKIEYEHVFLKYLKENKIDWNFMRDINGGLSGVVLGTIHGTKGLEFETIIIPEVNTYTSDESRQLLYVAMTRSKKRLILSAHESTTLVQDLRAAKGSGGNVANGA